MIVEATTIGQGVRLQADVCIVGSGACGIAMALRLAEAGEGLSVLLLEAGHVALDKATQDLYGGEVADERLHSPPDKYRHRRFGGSTALWGGRCVPFDPIDFEQRGHVPFSGWPIGYDDLAPFYPEANTLCEAGRFDYDADSALGKGAPYLIRGFHSSLVHTNSIERFSCPTNFATRYQDRLARSPDVRVLLGANCTGIRLQSGGGSVRELDVATLSGLRFSVSARSIVIATGGLETARLLLASRDVTPAGVGNENDVVGRYYQCHIAGNVGLLTVQGSPDDVRHGYEISPDGVYCRRRFSLSAEAQRRLGVGNMVARLHFPRITDPAHRNGVLSGLFLARRLISYEYGKRLNNGAAGSLANSVLHLRNILLDPLDTAGFLWNWVTRRTLVERKFPSVILRNRSNRFSLEIHSEQMPEPKSRITLADSVDALGMPRLRVDWRYGARDIESIRTTLDAFASEFARSGVARFEYDHDTLEQDLTRYGAYGGHHIGTARMGTDPRTSVVDASCRVHSVDNLFVAGSAVFTTSSQANPTLTAIALSLRLADHLARRGTRAPMPSRSKDVTA